MFSSSEGLPDESWQLFMQLAVEKLAGGDARFVLN